MKETPILFTPANYQAILDGSKTQTRRTKGLEYVNADPDGFELRQQHEGLYFFFPKGGAAGGVLRCPYGHAGDRLWVREGLERRDLGVRYRRDKATVSKGEYTWQWQRDTLSPIHMPKWAARLWLEIVEVRVQRLQEISEEDAKAEGAAFTCVLCGQDLDTVHGAEVHWACDDPDCMGASHREGFHRLWESINGPGSWDENPWVWAISFKVVTP